MFFLHSTKGKSERKKWGFWKQVLLSSLSIYERCIQYIVLCLISSKHCRMHSRPKVLSPWLIQINTFSSKQKLQQALKSWSNFCVFFFAKGKKYMKQLWQILVTFLTNPCNSLEKSIHRFWQIHVTTKRNLCINLNKFL